ncbi:MAG: hypothetical protein A3H94_03520 [Acidobacteria bacterium RIFCSPLOWO2_02_FULL_60_20]|nr:MAG: hypothetical protein A3H94_03520 [Acidobacteria bacterium RIFCSPLOWO2_02_FULL_60_20]
MGWSSEEERPRQSYRQDDGDDHFLPTISLIHLPHPKIPNLYQRCFEYNEPWQWSPVTELVETGQWFFASGSRSMLRWGGE